MKQKLLIHFLSVPFFLMFTGATTAQTKILFDATKAEMAGNADWVIDADSHNLGFSNGPAVLNYGSESNPQRYPTPAQSGITATTTETYWDGALSYWAIDCVKQGYEVETLPYNGQITYGVSSNPQDLSNYKVYVIVEPNIMFTTSEKNAIINFVSNGGGLCIISDHDQSDRNNDGDDSPHILNDLMSNNQVQANPFGISFDYVDISQTTSNVANLPTNTILHGTAGNVTQVKWSDGTTMTLNTAQNSTAKGLIFKTGSSTTGSVNVLCASAVYNNGKVVAIGDSSIPDDGTGDANDVLYNGYIDDVNGNHKRLLMNAIIWLASSGTMDTNQIYGNLPLISVVTNPVKNGMLVLNYNDDLPLILTIFDISGRVVGGTTINKNNTIIPVTSLNPAMYFCTATNAKGNSSFKFIVN